MFQLGKRAALLPSWTLSVERWTLDVNDERRASPSGLIRRRSRSCSSMAIAIFAGAGSSAGRKLPGAVWTTVPIRRHWRDFPEIPVEDCTRAVQFVETDGTVYRAAEAVFRSLGYSRGRRWLGGAYDRVPGFAAITEAAYSMVARHRSIASACTRFLWGEDVRRPTYFVARRGFLKTLGLIYLIAFISVWCQMDGLMGAHGIIPAGEMLRSLDRGLGMEGCMHAPTICWWDSSDATLHGLCLVGTAAAGLLTFGLLPIPTLLRRSASRWAMSFSVN